MNKSEIAWAKASQLLADTHFFQSELNRVQGKNLVAYPQEMELPATFREEARLHKQYEHGVRNTLEYLVHGRISLCYRLRGCSWARTFNGPAPPFEPSYTHCLRVTNYLLADEALVRRTGKLDQVNRHTPSSALICACLMVGLPIRTRMKSEYPEVRLGKPWAIAGVQPEKFTKSSDETMARFWRWVVQQERSDSGVEEFIRSTVERLYEGSTLLEMEDFVRNGSTDTQNVFHMFRDKFGVSSSRAYSFRRKSSQHKVGFLAGHIEVPDDFDDMNAVEIEVSFLSNNAS